MILIYFQITEVYSHLKYVAILSGIQRAKLAIGTNLSPPNYLFIWLLQNITANINFSVVLMLL